MTPPPFGAGPGTAAGYPSPPGETAGQARQEQRGGVYGSPCPFCHVGFTFRAALSQGVTSLDHLLDLNA
jgi:hypothetical protein